MSVNQRIKQVRNVLGLSQAKFAKGISISNGYIAEIELENRKANDRIIKLISSVYGVSEHWLKSGEGEMFTNYPDDEIFKRVSSIFKELRPEFQEYVLQQIDKLLELQGKSGETTKKAHENQPTDDTTTETNEN